MTELGISIAEIAYRGVVPDGILNPMLEKERVKNAIQESLPTHQNKHRNIDLTSWALNHLCKTALEMNAQDLLELQGEVQMLSETIGIRIEKICPDCKGEGRPEGFADCEMCGGSEFCD